MCLYVNFFKNYIEKIIFKVVFEKIRIFGVYFIGWFRVVRVIYIFGFIDVVFVFIVYFFILGINVDIVNGLCDRLRVSRIKFLVLTETYRFGK